MLQHTATHRNTLQHPATRCNTLHPQHIRCSLLILHDSNLGLIASWGVYIYALCCVAYLCVACVAVCCSVLQHIGNNFGLPAS